MFSTWFNRTDIYIEFSASLTWATLFSQRPESLNKQPSVLPAVEVIAPGGSYNPDFFSHQVLLRSQLDIDQLFVSLFKSLFMLYCCVVFISFQKPHTSELIFVQAPSIL